MMSIAGFGAIMDGVKHTTSPTAGGSPSGHCGHSTHADQIRTELDSMNYRLDRIDAAEVDEVAELNAMHVLLSQIQGALHRLRHGRHG